MKLEQNFVKYLVHFLGNGVSRNNVFETTLKTTKTSVPTQHMEIKLPKNFTFSP